MARGDIIQKVSFRLTNGAGTVGFSATPADGDLIVISLMADNGNITPPVPTGFTLYGDSGADWPRAGAGVRVASSEPNGNYNVDYSNVNVVAGVCAWHIEGPFADESLVSGAASNSGSTGYAGADNPELGTYFSTNHPWLLLTYASLAYGGGTVTDVIWSDGSGVGTVTEDAQNGPVGTPDHWFTAARNVASQGAASIYTTWSLDAGQKQYGQGAVFIELPLAARLNRFTDGIGRGIYRGI